MDDINSDEYFEEVVRINEAKKEALKEGLSAVYDFVYEKEE